MDRSYSDSFPRPRKPDPVKALVYSILVAIAGYIALGGYFEFRLIAEKSRTENRAHGQASANVDGRNTRRRDGYLAIERRMREHDQELETVFGDRVLAIARNPRLSIAQEIEALARSIAPADSNVQVAVDRFTDFNVTIQLPAEKSPAEMAEICARMLEHDAKYLHRIRFYAQNRFAGELDSTAMASSATDVALLTESLAKSVVDSPTPAPAEDPSATAQGMSEEDDALRKRLGEWNSSIERHLRGLNEIITGLSDCIDLSTLTNKSELSERLSKLDTFTEQISSEQAYFARAIDKLREAIADHDPLVVSIIIRDVQQRQRGLFRQTTPLLLEVTTLQSHIRELLKYLDAHRNEWKVDGGDQIAFATPSAHISFNMRKADVVRSVQQVEQRLRAMKTAASPTTQ